MGILRRMMGFVASLPPGLTAALLSFILLMIAKIKSAFGKNL